MLPLDWETFSRPRGLPGEPPGEPIGVYMTADALREAERHGRSSPHAEVGGILYGRIYRDGAHTAVDVVAAIPAADADGTPVHLVFTPEAWEHVFSRRADLPDDLEIVGWYHTHPGLGVFLSGTDRRTHASNFSRPWHVALVLDPLRGDVGAFVANEPVGLARYGLPREVPPEPALSAAVLRYWLAGAACVAAAGLFTLLLLARDQSWRSARAGSSRAARSAG